MARTATKTEKPGRKARVHQSYYNAAGVKVPGTTTITGLLDKSSPLKYWAWGLGQQGIKLNEYVDQLADAGTLAHYMVQCYLTGEDPDEGYLAEFSRVDHDRAENAMIKFYTWADVHKVTEAQCEMQLVSEDWQYGGTNDIYCKMDGARTLIDIKTSKAIYGDMYTQVAAYKKLLEENGFGIDTTVDPNTGMSMPSVYILRIGRTEEEGFEFRRVPGLDLHLERFKNLRDQYEINRRLKQASAA